MAFLRKLFEMPKRFILKIVYQNVKMIQKEHGES